MWTESETGKSLSTSMTVEQAEKFTTGALRGRIWVSLAPIRNKDLVSVVIRTSDRFEAERIMAEAPKPTLAVVA